MLARAISYTTLGLEALPVDVEVDASQGLPTFTIVGLPDQAVREARERVRAALLNSQLELPSRRLIVNLAPADIKKEGGVFDLAIALGVLAASGQLDPAAVASVVAVGELALDGSVRPVPGVLPIARALPLSLDQSRGLSGETVRTAPGPHRPPHRGAGRPGGGPDPGAER